MQELIIQRAHLLLNAISWQIILVSAGIHLVGYLLAWLISSRWRSEAKTGMIEAVTNQRFRFLLLLFLWLGMTELVCIQLKLSVIFIELPARLILAWLIITVLCAPIKRRTIATFISVTTWSIAALDILDLFHPLIQLLDEQTFSVASVDVTLLSVLKSAISLASLFWLATWFLRVFEKRLYARQELHPSAKILVAKAFRVLLLATTTIWGLSIAGVDPSLLAVFSGSIAVGAAFGLQNVISNLFCGTLLLMDRTIKPGDVIGLNDGKVYGVVDKLNARCVSLKSREGIEYLIPNEYFITNRVENWSYSSKAVRVKIDLRVAADADLNLVEETLQDILRGISRVQKSPAPAIRFRGMLENWIDVQARIWIEDPENGSSGIRSELIKQACQRFRAQGILVPIRLVELKHSN